MQYCNVILSLKINTYFALVLTIANKIKQEFIGDPALHKNRKEHLYCD